MIFLSAGHNNNDSGAIGVGGLKEADLTKELRDLISKYIPAENLFKDDDNWNVGQTAAAIENYPSTENDIICDLHFNDSDNVTASGVEVIIPKDYDDKEMTLATSLCEVVSTILGIRNRGVKTEDETPRGRLAMMRPTGINVLIETCFISNPQDMQSYQNHKTILAEELAKKLQA